MRSEPLADLHSADLIVVGAGINGCIAALRAAERGAKVIVIEKEVAPAGEQSGRAQGALRAFGKHGPAIPLTEEALGIWREAAEEADAEIVFEGSLSVARQPGELDVMRDIISQHESYGLPSPEVWSETETRKRVPALEGSFSGSVFRPGDGHCNPRKATLYFARKADALGVRFFFGVKALRILEKDGRVRGVETSQGTFLAPKLAVAGGIWSQLLARTIELNVPLMPIVLSGCESTPLLPLFGQSIRSFGFSGHQRPNGRVVISAGVNAMVRHEVNLLSFDQPALWLPRFLRHWRKIRVRLGNVHLNRQLELGRWSPEQIQEENAPRNVDRKLMRGAKTFAEDLIPALKNAGIARYWAGYIDMSPDGLPIIDTKSCPDGMVLCTGLSGHGLVLGPVIGKIVADLALDGQSSHATDIFRLARFVEEKVPIPANTI